MTPPVEIDESFPAPFVVEVFAEEEQKVVNRGTGFFVTVQGHVATCRHVVLNESKTTARFIYVRCGNEERIRYCVVDQRPEADLVVLAPCAGIGFPREPVALLVDPTAAAQREGYRLWGRAEDRTRLPSALTVTIATGFLREARIGLETAIHEGDSGGPIVWKGTRILVAVAQSKTEAKEGRGAAIPANLLIDLLKQWGLTILLARTDRQIIWSNPALDPTTKENHKQKDSLMEELWHGVRTAADIAPAVDALESMARPALPLMERLHDTHHQIDMAHIDDVVQRLVEMPQRVRTGNFVIEQHPQMAGHLCVQRILAAAERLTELPAIHSPVDLSGSLSRRMIHAGIIKGLAQGSSGQATPITENHDDAAVFERAVAELAACCAASYVRVFEFKWWLPSSTKPELLRSCVDELWHAVVERIGGNGGTVNRHVLFVVSCSDCIPPGFAESLDGVAEFDRGKLYRLGLRDYGEQDIVSWLQHCGELPPEEAALHARVLYQCTNGVPEALVRTWRSTLEASLATTSIS